MMIVLRLDFDQSDTDWRPLALALTGDDNDAVLAAERALNGAVERLTGVYPEVEIELGDSLEYLLTQLKEVQQT